MQNKKCRLKEIVSKFKDNEVITNEKVKMLYAFFPCISSWKCRNLKLSKESIYSISSPKIMVKIIDIIEKNLNIPIKDITVTDATANVGSSAISFALKAKFTNAVEINENSYKMLVNNINVYNLDCSKIKTYLNDYLQIMHTLQQDVIYIDPPWGGIDYYNNKKLNLYLSNVSIAEITNSLINNANLIIFKAPLNFNKEEFEKKSIFTNINYYYIKNILIVVLS